MTNSTHPPHALSPVDSEYSERFSEKHKAYQPPTVQHLQDSEPEGGDVNVPEGNDGLLS